LQTSPLRGLTPPLTTPYGDASLIIKMRHIINTRIISLRHQRITWAKILRAARKHSKGLILTSVELFNEYYRFTTIDKQKQIENIEI
jgi:hypothetical protein